MLEVARVHADTGSTVLQPASGWVVPPRMVRRQAFLLMRTEAGFRGQARAWKGLCPPSMIRLPMGLALALSIFMAEPQTNMVKLNRDATQMGVLCSVPAR